MAGKKQDAKHGFGSAFFTDHQPFVKSYAPKEINYLDIEANTEYSLEEQETFYTFNHQEIEGSMRILLINYFLTYVARKDYKKYSISAYCSDIANLILERGYKKNRANKEFLKFLLIHFFILPIFQKFEQLSEEEQGYVLQFMNKESPIQTYGPVMFLDHYMYYYFPDATMTFLEALYLLKKGIPEKNLQSLFQPQTSSSLQKYITPGFTADAILRILNIYENNRTYIAEGNTLEMAKISTKIKNYILLFESQFGEMEYEPTDEETPYKIKTIEESEVKYTMDTMSPGRFPITSTIIQQSEKASKELLEANMPVPKEKKGKKPVKAVKKKAETEDEEEEDEEEEEEKTSIPFSVLPPESMMSYFVPSNIPGNEKTTFVYTDAIRFSTDIGKVGQPILQPKNLPITNVKPLPGELPLPTKKAVYGIALIIAINDSLYSEDSLEKISKLIPGNTRILSKQEMQTNVFRFIGIGSAFVNVIARLYFSIEQVKSNDTDCVVLLNPDFDEETYNTIYNGIISIISNILCPRHTVQSDTVDIRTLKTKLSYMISPVNVSFFQNYGYFPRSANRAETKRVHLNISLFKVHEYLISNTILDVVVYLRNNRRLRGLWNIFALEPSEFHSVPIPNPVAVLIDTYSASKSDTRAESEGGKGISRADKVAFLKHILPRNDVEKFVTKTENSNVVSILRELYPIGGGSKRTRRRKRSIST